MVELMQNPLNPLNVLGPLLPHEETIRRRRKAIKSFKAKADAKRSPTEKFADLLTAKFGTIAFLTLNFVWFAVWIVINTGHVPGIKEFDPFPFGLLTMIVSLEAIGLAIIVLISQNREARVSELREEIELQLNTVSEGEVTKLINLMALLLEKQGVDISNDPELKKMLKPIDSAEMIRQLEEELDPNHDHSK
jgi:uncharacterized membrane protein